MKRKRRLAKHRSRMKSGTGARRTTAAAVVYAPASAGMMRLVLKQLRKLHLRELIIVLPEPSPGLLQTARSVPGVTVAFSPGLAAPDAGRALGAKLTTADKILFVDGERPVRAKVLAALLRLCGSKLDVVLNNVSARLGFFHRRRNAYRLAEFLNRTLNRRELRSNTLATLPYALSRRALNKIGAEALAAPAKAHASAIMLGLRVGSGPSIKPSPPPTVRDTQRWNKAANDHTEAWRAALNHRGKRLRFPDKVRNRSLLGESR